MKCSVRTFYSTRMHDEEKLDRNNRRNHICFIACADHDQNSGDLERNSLSTGSPKTENKATVI